MKMPPEFRGHRFFTSEEFRAIILLLLVVLLIYS